MKTATCIIFTVVIAISFAQRSPYLKRPFGYPVIEASTQTDGLGNRFAGADNSGTTQRLPVEALGDRDLFNRIGKLPIDRQPFWYINWQALEAQRGNPQTYSQKENTFIDVGSSGSQNNQNQNSIQ